MMHYQQLAYLSVSHAGDFGARFRQGGVTFWLRAQEIANLKSQLGAASIALHPMVFTEQGAVMLSRRCGHPLFSIELVSVQDFPPVQMQADPYHPVLVQTGQRPRFSSSREMRSTSLMIREQVRSISPRSSKKVVDIH